MNAHSLKSSALALPPVVLLLLVSCSSPPPPPPPAAQAPAPAAASRPEFVEVGGVVETGTGMVTVQSIDAAQRTLVLKREDGDLATFKAGPEVRRFNQIKVGDQIMSTVTDNLTLFLVKGQVAPEAAAAQGIVRTPEGSNVGGIIISAINVNAKVLDVDREARRVLLQFTPTQTRSVKVRPDVDLSKVAVNDTVLVRGTRSLSIMIANP